MAPRQISSVWKYFRKLNTGAAICKFCSKNLKTSGNTSNLQGHLKSRHRNAQTDFLNPSDQIHHAEAQLGNSPEDEATGEKKMITVMTM